MQALLKSAGLALILLFGATSQAAIIPMTLPGNVTGQVMGEDAWQMDDTAGVDFWTFEVTEAGSYSFSVSSAINFGLSLFSGTLTADPGFLFFHDQSFTSLFDGELVYVGGTAPYVPGVGNMFGINLAAGSYTLALGGNDFGPGFDSIDYGLSVAKVPEPSLLVLFLLALAGLVYRQQRG
ncbi:PEP-CTERM sorting domain-containing protein [Bowmanella sp. Y26]|uniref:PEP-CTERM sorting domain-containing protein n=1 Tax=Bowmanella yangjiangensis TaxID=2811230 RepID=UPI001BDD9E5C|nr:PEP-CTERM sorting domain-containing protein [Bowmanella yangjiangensis]MBT1064202.1 PEP-CTERM sorting domain-containing protein [Bowmanella yangjiangensis]